jgi:SAM-dependent MidA family methyltransferase
MLPSPSDSAIAHSEQLTLLIRQAIQQAGGSLPFADYMRLALYAPGFGYYVAGAHKFGESGDFTTAPEISPLYSYCIANQCAQVLEALDGGDILEFGAGTGKMAGDILLTLAARNRLPDHYYILEVSPELKERQRQFLADYCPDYLDRIHWLTTLPATPIKGVVLANEVLDAMPVNRFVWQEHHVVEQCVGWEGGHFVWRNARPFSPEFTAAAETLAQRYFHTLDDYQSEINLNLAGWLQSVGECLQQGLLLIVDYGFPQTEYYHPDRAQGTLMCHYRHHAHPDPFLWPGLQDITAHVDFTDVLSKAVTAGFTPAGYTSQAYFLLSCGLEQWLLEQPDDPSTQFRHHQAVKLLTLPSEMGELFKVIGLTKHFTTPLVGFEFDNRLGRL